MVRKLIMLSVLTILVCLIILTINSCSVSSTLRKFAEDDELRRAAEWQQIVIYDIIDKRSPEAVSEGAIKKEYPGEAGKLTNVQVPKDELQDAVLKRHLLELQNKGVIRQAKDGYVSSPNARP